MAILTMTAKLTASVRRHPMASLDESCSDLWVGTIETRAGRVYSCTWRRDEPPTEAEVLEAWTTDRKAFRAGY